jgi:hypothetical protein
MMISDLDLSNLPKDYFITQADTMMSNLDRSIEVCQGDEGQQNV